MKYKVTLRILFGFLLCGFLAGCVSFPKSKYVAQKKYLFELPKVQTKIDAKSCKHKVFFDHVESIPPFDQLNFLYRVGTTRYLVDYYNGFLVSPSEQIDSILELSYGGFSTDVIKPASHKNRLQVKLVELYADYRNKDNPKGVIALHFILTRLVDEDKNKKTKVLIDKVFRASIPLREKGTECLINAWNRGLLGVLKRSFHELQNKLDC